MQHSDVADEVALACGGEDLFRAVPRLEHLDFPAQENCQPEVALSGFINQLALLHDPPFRYRLE